MAGPKRVDASKRGGAASAGHVALLARYAELDPNRIPEGAEFLILTTETEELALISFPEAKPAEIASAAARDLTAAEAAVLQHLLLGHSNATIAHARMRSVRTIAHQVASIFRKVGVNSRRELLATFRRANEVATVARKRAR